MTLTDANGRSIERPSAFQIENAIRALPGGQDSFLILSKDEMTYVQVAGGGNEAFLLEYQEGSLDKHYQAVGEDVTVESVISVFQAYAAGARDWRRIVRWENEDLAAPSQPGRMRNLIRGSVYFALVFSAGFILGIARVLWLVPRVGERQAELLEAPVMLVVIVLAARFVVRRVPASHRSGYFYSGAVALVLLLGVEFSVVLALRGLSIAEYFAQRDPVAGIAYVTMLVVFVAMPWLLGSEHRANG